MFYNPIVAFAIVSDEGQLKGPQNRGEYCQVFSKRGNFDSRWIWLNVRISVLAEHFDLLEVA